MQEEKNTTRLVELEPRLLVLFLFIAIPFTFIGSLFILGSVRNEMNQRAGAALADMAAGTARYLDSYILHNVTAVSMLASSPTVIAGAVEANRQYRADHDTVQRELLQRDRQWREGADPSLVQAILHHTVSDHLRQVVAFHPAYREILLTDERGALVAATNPATDYYQADENWWQRAFGDGDRGSIYVSGVQFDQSAGSYAMDIAVPIGGGAGGGQSFVAGVLKTLLDARDLFGVVGTVRVGATGRALLLDSSNRTILTGYDPNELMQARYPGYPKLREALGEGRGFFVSRHPDDRIWLAGFSRMPQPSPSPDLDWLVVVEQALEEAQAPARAATIYLLMFFTGMVLIVLLFSLYMHFRLVRPIREVDLREEMDRLARAEAQSTG